MTNILNTIFKNMSEAKNVHWSEKVKKETGPLFGASGNASKCNPVSCKGLLGAS